MDAITALLGRNSASRLTDPAPAGAQREQIFAAALRAPDHGRLQPWRFLVVEGHARQRLGEVLANAIQRYRPDVTAEELAKLRANPLRAPLVVVLAAHIVPHPKVPELEQLLSVGCAAQNMLLAAHALGFAGMWRTGKITYTAELREELGLSDEERVLGFLYLGSVDGQAKTLSGPPVSAHFRSWGK